MNGGMEGPLRKPNGSLSGQVRLARLWLPLAIVGVVIVYQLAVLPRGGPTFRFWAPLLFYGVLGPLATYVTLNWIARGARERERAQADLARLYEELRASHELLSAIQDVTLRYAAAPDLEGTIAVAARGVAKVTGAVAVGLVVGPAEFGASQGVGLTPVLEADSLSRDRQLRASATEADTFVEGEFHGVAGEHLVVLSAPLSWGGRPEGSLHAYYEAEPGPSSREALGILASQFAAVAEATRLRMRDLLTLIEVDRRLRAEGNLERLLDAVLKEITARVAAPAGGVFLLDEESLLQLRASTGIDRTGPPPSWKVGEGVVGRVALQREPRMMESLSDAERRGAGPLLKEAGSAVALPLTSDDRLLGVIVLSHPEENHFERSSIPFLGLLASQVSLAVSNAAAYLHSEELAIAEERARIAREIHDGVAQLLAFTLLKLGLADKLMSKNPQKAVEALEQARETVRETIKELRRSIFALRPVDLERYGFVETVRRYVLDFGQQNDIKVHVTIGDLPTLSVKQEAVLFRIFQEAMHNVAKHAKAGVVEVELGTAADGMAFVAVRDDGQGFDPQAVGDRVTSAGGIGLKQMRERVEARGGRLEVVSGAGNGTTISAAIPG
jgi:signal transduction histidine kinase